MIYDCRDAQCPPGKIIDLDTDAEVEHARRLDTGKGEIEAPKISSAWLLWKNSPDEFLDKFSSSEEPARYEAVLKDPGNKSAGYRLVYEVRKGRFEFRPLPLSR